MPDKRIRLPELMHRVHDVAPMPQILEQVMTLLQDERASAADLAKVIALDQGLTVRVLRLANSAHYARPRRVATAKDAVVTIGFNEVRDLVLARGLWEAFSRGVQGPLRQELFWSHAVTCGVVAQLMAKETGLAAPEEAFTGGLLHDIGKLVLNRELPQQFSEAVQMTLNRGIPLVEAEFRVFGFTHADVGWEMSRRWSFPLSLGHVLAHHHSADLRPDREPLTYIVAQANKLCHDYGWSSDIDPSGLTAQDEGGGDDPYRARLLERLGGVEQVLERSRAYLEAVFGMGHAWYRHRRPSEAAHLLNRPW
ncbi:MAG TPA: HDOD domain-containing protein [Dehalococcoidia bacterium]